MHDRPPAPDEAGVSFEVQHPALVVAATVVSTVSSGVSLELLQRPLPLASTRIAFAATTLTFSGGNGIRIAALITVFLILFVLADLVPG